MIHRVALLGAAGLTAFTLAVAAGVLAHVAQPERMAVVVDAQVVDAEVSEATPEATAEPSIQALLQEREADYRQRLEQANEQLRRAAQQQETLQQSNEQLRELAQRQAPPGMEQGRPALPVPAPVAGPVLMQAPPRPAPPQPQPQAPSSPRYPVSPDAAANVAVAAVRGARLNGTPDLVEFQGVAAYEVPLDRGNVYVDATSGKVLYDGAAAAPSSGQVGREQAIQTARAYAGESAVREVETKRERGLTVYEVKFASDSKVYVDVASGQVAHAKLARASSRSSAGEREREEEDDD